jgi:hypothetical protein
MTEVGERATVPFVLQESEGESAKRQGAAAVQEAGGTLNRAEPNCCNEAEETTVEGEAASTKKIGPERRVIGPEA